MRIRSDATTGSVIIAIPVWEAMRLASELVQAAQASGLKIKQEDRQEPPVDEDTEAWEA